MKRCAWMAAVTLLLGGVTACGADDDGGSPAQTGEDAGTGSTDAGGTPSTDTGNAEPDAAGTDAGGSDSGGSTDPFPGCSYPASEGWGYGQVVPEVQWAPAFLGDGTETVFGTREFFCDPQYDAYDTLVVLVSAEWCPNCPQLIDWIDGLSPRLEAEGAYIMYVESQDNYGDPAESTLAQSHFSRYAKWYDSGVRVGDANATPVQNRLFDSPSLAAFPTALVVRRSDMLNIADSSQSRYYLPFVEIAMDPDGNWAAPGPPSILPEYPPNCAEGDDEAGEPNDTAADAISISAGTVDGAICDGQPDFYRVDVAGPWTATLTISAHGQERTDLDIMVWNEATDSVLRDDGGAKIGSETDGRIETFDYEGPALVRVYGFDGSTSPYTLEIEAR